MTSAFQGYQDYLELAKSVQMEAQDILKKEGLLDKSRQENPLDDVNGRDEDSSHIQILKKDFKKGKESYISHETLELNSEEQGTLRIEDEGHPLNSTLTSQCHEQKTNGKCPISVRDRHFPTQNVLPSDSKAQILVFVSFSMPEASLKALLIEAQDKNVVLVLRGLVEDSFVKTAQKLKDINILDGGVEINPELFDEYDVKAVPTFIQIRDEKIVARLQGNVSLAYALDAFKKAASS